MKSRPVQFAGAWEMTQPIQSQSARKHKAITEAAAAAFLKNGYVGTSMEEIAAIAHVSKQTVYKHFSDKERLFKEIVLATADEVNHVVRLLTTKLADTQNLEKDLRELARRFVTILMQPQLLRLRRLVIANADRLPELGRTWYEQGFGRVLSTLATCFHGLVQRRLLYMDDPLVAANHFVGMLLWIPVNQAMFTGNHHLCTRDELERHADAAVAAFLNAYGSKSQAKPNSVPSRRHASR